MTRDMNRILLVMVSLTLIGPAAGQPSGGRSLPPPPPPPVKPRSVQNTVRPEAEAYRRLHRIRLSQERLDASKRFVERFGGTQLALRVIREAAELYILQESHGTYHPLEACAVWMGKVLNSPAFNWQRYRNAPNSVFLDRLETHLMFARVLASSRTYRHGPRNGFLASRRTYDRALKELERAVTETEQRPRLLEAREDLLEQIQLTRCWCLHGKEDYPAALSSYEWFMERFPDSDFTPAVLFNAASCLKILVRRGSVPDSAEAASRVEFYHRRLLEEFPGSAETVRLRQQLQSSP